MSLASHRPDIYIYNYNCDPRGESEMSKSFNDATTMPQLSGNGGAPKPKPKPTPGKRGRRQAKKPSDEAAPMGGGGWETPSGGAWHVSPTAYKQTGGSK